MRKQKQEQKFSIDDLDLSSLSAEELDTLRTKARIAFENKRSLHFQAVFNFEMSPTYISETAEYLALHPERTLSEQARQIVEAWIEGGHDITLSNVEVVSAYLLPEKNKNENP